MLLPAAPHSESIITRRLCFHSQKLLFTPIVALLKGDQKDEPEDGIRSKSGIFMKIVINNFYSETHIVKFFTQSHKIHHAFPVVMEKMQMLASFLYVYLTLWDAYLKEVDFVLVTVVKMRGRKFRGMKKYLFGSYTFTFAVGRDKLYGRDSNFHY